MELSLKILEIWQCDPNRLTVLAFWETTKTNQTKTTTKNTPISQKFTYLLHNSSSLGCHTEDRLGKSATSTRSSSQSNSK